jgi:hypothetical protein
MRFRGHCADIRHAIMKKPVGAHFSKIPHLESDVTITIVNNSNNWTTSQRIITEESYIGVLETLHPRGLNIIE